MSLTDLYREVIVEHYKHPRNKGELPDPTVRVELYNPVCGDEIELKLAVREGRIEAARFTGKGCSISQASASMMTEAIEGRSVEEVAGLVESFKRFLRGEEPAGGAERLGELVALEGVRRFPVRIKCALLSWSALEQSLQKLAAKE